MVVAFSAVTMLLTSCISEKESYFLHGRDYGANKEITDGNYDKSMAVKCHNGTFVGEAFKGFATWRGIPFAKAPVGELRFKAPVAPDASDKVYEAYNYGKMPIAFMEENDSDTFSEDCLYLNVFTSKNDKKNKPVMVFIHGGGFTVGNASTEILGEWFIMRHPDVVFVTVEYRLGCLGFTNFDDVPGSEDFIGAQNNGLKDMLMALKWVNQNIAGFGGDTKNITLFGESAGSISTSLLVVCDEAKGLFQKAILESGTPDAALEYGSSKTAASAMLEEFGAKNMEDLQKVSTQDFIDHINNIMNVCYSYGPALDGEFLPKDPFKEYADGKGNDVKVLVGYTEEECRYFINLFKIGNEVGTARTFHPWMQSRYDNLMNFMGDDEESKAIANGYIAQCKAAGETDDFAIESLMSELSFGMGSRNIADLQSEHNDTYLYYFAYPAYGPLKGSAHGSEMLIVFNEIIPKEYMVGDVEALYNQTAEIWDSFAKTGVPTLNGKPIPKYDTEKQSVIVFDKDGKVFTKDNYLTERHNYLKPLSKYENFTVTNNFFASTDEWASFIDTTGDV